MTLNRHQHILLAVTIVICSFCNICASSFALAQNVDSILVSFEKQKKNKAEKTAETFFGILMEQGFSEDSIRILKGSSPDSIKALTWYWAAEWFYDSQDYDKAIVYSEKALKKSQSTGAKEIECDCCNTLSIALFRKSDYRSSLKYAKRTLELGRELNDEGRIANALNTLAGICLTAKQPSEGEKYILEAISLCEKNKDSLKLAVRCGMAAEIYHSMGDDIKSLEYSKRAYDINSAMGLKEKAAVRLSQMAAAQIALQQYDEARQSLIKALPILKSAGNLQSWAISCNQLGDIYLQEGDNTSAASYYKSALEVFIGKGDAYNMSHSYQGLSEALIKTDPAPAAEYLKHYIQIKDSLYDSEMNQGLNEYNARYKNDVISSERDRHIKANKQIASAGIAITILLLLAIFLLIHKNKSSKIALDEISLKIEQLKDSRSGSRSGSTSKTSNEDLVEKFKIQVHDLIKTGHKVDLQAVADSLCTSRANLNRLIKAKTGESSSSLVSKTRVDIAKEILRANKDIPIAELAARCGIEDVSYFINLFKKYTGSTPKQWKEQDKEA